MSFGASISTTKAWRVRFFRDRVVLPVLARAGYLRDAPRGTDPLIRDAALPEVVPSRNASRRPVFIAASFGYNLLWKQRPQTSRAAPSKAET